MPAGSTALAGRVLYLVPRETFETLFILMMLLFFRLIFRGRLLVSCAYIVAVTVTFVLLTEAHPVLGWFTVGIGSALALWVLTRLGFLAGIVMQFTGALLTQFPLTRG